MAQQKRYQPFREFVEPNIIDGQFTSSSFIEIAAGPPRLSNLAGAAINTIQNAIDADYRQTPLFYPIGLVQNLNFSQNMNLVRLFEIGSLRSVFIPGHTIGQVTLSRPMYHGPSLLRVMYAYYQDLLPPTTIKTLVPGAAITMPNAHNVVMQPGYENIFLNLASDLFYQAVGLLLTLKDVNEDTLGAIYLESCYTPQHNLSTDAQGVVIMEQAVVQYERAVPVAVKVVPLKLPNYTPTTPGP